MRTRVVAACLTLALGGVAIAQPGGVPAAEAVATELIPGVAPGDPPPPEQVQQLSYAIGLGLRCPVCQGLSVADSTSEAAVSMQRRIRELVAAGYSREQIEAYFVDRYGEWVLLDPPANGLNWLIWLAPGLAAGFGLVWAASVVTRWRAEPEDPVPLPSDLGRVPKDEFEERLLAELDE